MTSAEALACAFDDPLHVMHDVGSKQLAVHPATVGLDTSCAGEDEADEA